MTAHEYRDTVEALWSAAESRDWTTYAGYFADDLVVDMPPTRERLVGRDAWVRFNSEYPGEWHAEVRRIVADDDGAVSWVEVHVGDESETGISFFTFDGAGRVATIRDFWPVRYDPPAGREHLVERC
ncbi:hypothetical protein GCM10027059_29160 [Myceligenerans halotolerans]